MPGVSRNAIWAPGIVLTPRIRWRVVWGLSETIAIFCRTRVFNRVDFPTFVRPTSAAKPARWVVSAAWRPPLTVPATRIAPLLLRLEEADPHPANPAPVRLGHFEMQAGHFHRLPRLRKPAEQSDDEPAHGIGVHVRHRYTQPVRKIEDRIGASHEIGAVLLADEVRPAD